MKYVDPDGREAITFSFLTVFGVAVGASLLLSYVATLPMNPTYQEWCKQTSECISIGIQGTKDNISYAISSIKTKIGSKAESKLREQNPYHIKIQFQGPSVKGESRNTDEGCKEINIWSDKPINAEQVKIQLTEKYKSLSNKEQIAISHSYLKTMKFIDEAEKNGGIGPAAISFDSKTGLPGDRVDVIICGDINLTNY